MSMVPIGFAALVRAARAGGFDAVSVTGSVYRRGVRDEGLTVDGMRSVLDGEGIGVTEVEGVAHWLTPADDKPSRWARPTDDGAVIELAVALGAPTVVAVHFGSPRPLEESGSAFAALCDRAATPGLQVALEPVAFATIADVASAWDIVRLADRVNGGILLDTWHHRRTAGDDDALRAVPGHRVFGVQLADGDATPRGPLDEDVLHRRLPGSGSFDLPAMVSELDAMGVAAPVGVEVWDEQLLAEGAPAAARRLGDAVRGLLGIPG
jgi:sugar phosphate isomerase/epimerase